MAGAFQRHGVGGFLMRNTTTAKFVHDGAWLIMAPPWTSRDETRRSGQRRLIVNMMVVGDAEIAPASHRASRAATPARRLSTKRRTTINSARRPTGLLAWREGVALASPAGLATHNNSKQGPARREISRITPITARVPLSRHLLA